jgi:2-phospho-L-lactate guanylyltransferase
VITEGARDGHTGAVDGGRRVLAAEGRAGFLTMPGDIPLVTSAEISTVLAAASPFTIVPAHDKLGSNAVLCMPPLAVKLRFGEDSFYPHLDAARAAGFEPRVIELPGIGMDIDHPADLVRFLGMAQSAGTPTEKLLRGWGW